MARKGAKKASGPSARVCIDDKLSALPYLGLSTLSNNDLDEMAQKGYFERARALLR
ncbi:hypothetical protein EJB05_46979, partial [Eragrostis curvula]